MAKNRRLVSIITAGAAAMALAVAAAPHASADPNPNSPGTPPAGITDPSKIYAGVGADAFAELTNNLVAHYNADTSPTVVLASYDAVNPLTGVAGETITTKPGCQLVRPNGANAGLSAIGLGQQSTVDSTAYCIDFVRSSRAKNTVTNPGDANLTFYAQSRDAVSYATIGNAYAPTVPLTTTQLKDIFECTDKDWSDVGGQAGPIHLYLPPTTAATYTFFLSAIGSSTGAVASGCNGLPTVFSSQQNDGRTMLGDPEGITPYAVTKWAAQSNGAPGISDYRGGTQIGLVNTGTLPFTTGTVTGDPTTYTVLNPAFAAGASASFGRLFYNVVRNTAPADLKAIFAAGGYVCMHADALLIPFGNTPLGNDTNQSPFCGMTS